MDTPVKNLMRRINDPGFLSQEYQDQLTQIQALQQKRLTALANARTTGTKSAAKNKAKTETGKAATKSAEKQLAALLDKLTPEQIAAIKSNLPKED